MVSVFLSHSSKDKPFVRDLAAALETGGDIQVWLDEREIGYGENIVVKIGEGLDADAVLLILSPDSVDSKWVKEEWTDAYWDQVENQRTKLAGVLYRDCKIPRLLRNKKYFDLRTNQPEGFRQIKSWLLDLRPPVAPPVHLPSRSARFIGREEQIDTLSQQLKEEGSLAYISGLGGRGKTTLALEYAPRHKAKFESVHWLPCQQRSLVQIAGELAFQLGLKLDGDLEAIVHELNGHSSRKRCLLIFDNVDDETPERLLLGGRTSVLITTRATNLRFLRGYRPVDLPLFTEEQCFELFRDVIGAEEVDRHAGAARTIFHKLGLLPIGISIAAALLREDPLLTIDEMARNPPADVYALFAEAIAALSVSARSLLAGMAASAPEGFRLARELERRGHRFARYADDCNVYVRSRRAGQRLMGGLTRLVEGKLKLKVNREKSAVARPWERKFLGFSFTNGRQPKRRIAPKAKSRFEARVRILTRRTRGISIETMVRELGRYLQGWQGYFGFCQTPTVLDRFNKWIRRRIRSAACKQWRTGKTRYARLRELGLSHDLAARTAGHQWGPWRLSRTEALSYAMPAAYFDRLGLPSLCCATGA